MWGGRKEERGGRALRRSSHHVSHHSPLTSLMASPRVQAMCIHLLRYYKGAPWKEVASEFIGGFDLSKLSLSLDLPKLL